MNLIIMPYLNAAELTLAAAQDCLAQTTADTVLLLIDNGSQEEARSLGDQLRSVYPMRVLTWHWDPPHPSLAGCWNRALRFCWEAGADHALVVNNDVRLHPDTYAVLLNAQEMSGAWFVTGVGVTPEQFDPTIDLWVARGTPSQARNDGVRPEGFHYGGPDFSCYLITKECHKWFQFDEGFTPAYHEDNDFHRRLKLAGFGDRIYGLNVPFLHYGSGTLTHNPRMRETWPARFAKCQEYYIQKWGGLPGSETFTVPGEGTWYQGQDPASLGDPRLMMTGQGRPGFMGPTKGLFDAAGR